MFEALLDDLRVDAASLERQNHVNPAMDADAANAVAALIGRPRIPSG